MKRLSEIRTPINELTAFQDPPTVLIMRRKAIRLFPNNQRVATYRNDNLNLEVAIPYNPETLGQHKLSTVGTNIGEAFEEIPADFKVNTIEAAYDRLAKENPKSDLDNALLGWLESERYENGEDVGDWDKDILDDVFDDYQALIGVNEHTMPSDDIFGYYVHALQSKPGRNFGHLENHVAVRYGDKAANHFKAAGSHYVNGETDQANHHYAKYKHEAAMVGEETVVESTKGDVGVINLPGHYLHNRIVTMRNPSHKMSNTEEPMDVVDHGIRSYRVPIGSFKKNVKEEVIAEGAQNFTDDQKVRINNPKSIHHGKSGIVIGKRTEMTSPHTKSVVYRVSHDGGYSSHPHLGKHLVKEEVIAEATIHSLHAIARSKTPANVRFKNGSSAMVHHGTAARVMRLHSLMRKHNKRKVEALVNSSPDGLKKVVDFVDTHLK